ncbi:MAG: DNA polymerase III subunit gamma/tau [Burkholderiales bacterium]|uniref:DNA polymerase III subunit gamma/tau n=1 Tax=Ottowia pentelensis TaxID=511108 RepID=A0ABV6PUN4_9BURK|nr:DNA polymerase III subunit gamma/tau [Ottowia sp.]MBN9404381.1 DNA polymerase III subunit gamma/tau [Burkholderiales bacterium]MBS0412934.1 DNA polymerase III subunit gamma/tau [Pseudomonadota bacterium]
MSYLVLARKYRPRNFAELVGQEHVVQALSNALTQQRLHHAYLFTGTRGVGKTTVSRILAKSLNCTGADGQGGITATPCGVCPACTDIDAGRFVDYTELDAASNRGVDEVQGLLEQAVYKPVQGRFKVFMIDEVHMLTNTAFNAMLKTLEEPPEYLKFVLATTDPQKVPVTVLSRCLQFNLRPMAPETVQEHLQRVLAAEQVSADAPALCLLARAARGSMRDALSLTDQAIAFGSGQLHEAAVRQMLGSVDRSVVFSLIEALAQGDGRAVVEQVDQLRAAGQSAATTLEDMAGVLQRMAVQQAVPTMAVDESDRDAVRTAQLAQRMPADETQLLYSLCIHGRAELGLAPDEYVGLTMVLLRLLPFKPGPAAGATAEKKTLKAAEPAAHAPAAASHAQAPVAASVAAARAPDGEQPPSPHAPTPTATAQAGPPVQALPVREPGRPAPEPRAASPAPFDAVVATPVRQAAQSPEPPARPIGIEPAPPTVVPGAEGDFWHALVQKLVAAEAVTALTRELALQAELVARTADCWTLRVESGSLAQSGARERLQAALAEAGHTVQLQVELGAVKDCPARRNALAATQRQKTAESVLMADPFVQEMMREFGAKIVPGSVKPL